MPRSTLACLGSFLVLAAAIPAQVEWTQRPVISGQGCPMAYDAARARAVAFAGIGETYVGNGPNWVRLQLPSGPVQRCGHALAYDTVRQRVVMFGGHNEYPPFQDYDDTWEWDGTAWQQMFPANRPSVRWGQGMVYDQARGRCVLFGGAHGSTNLDDTWEWDGTNWTQRTPANHPSPRNFLGMAYDAARSVTVLFGGSDGSSVVFGDTWEWNGTDWTQRTPPVSPPVRFAHGMTYDPLRNRTVIFGGDPAVAGPPCRDDTWEWDGTTWTQAAPVTVPPARYRPGFAFDATSGTVLMFSGNSGSPDFTGLTDTWSWNGVDWTRIAPHLAPVRGSLAYDTARQRTVCYGGYMGVGVALAETWEWDGTSWTNRLPLVSPPPRAKSAVAYDQARGRLVMFGGTTGAAQPPTDTWEWDGTTWSQMAPATSPPGRELHAMAYDAARAKVVLYGGMGVNGPLLDTWEWNGVDWTLRNTPIRPNVFAAHGMAYDSVRQRTVLFGGTNLFGALLAETWEWDGNTWVQRSPVHAPAPRFYPQMAFDSARGRTVLYGEGDFVQEFYDTWEWDGTDWLQRSPATMPRPLLTSAIAYDSDREVTVFFANQTWEYGSTSQARFTSYGAGCAGSNGVPALAAIGGQRPWLGDVFTVGVTNVPPPMLGLIAIGFSSAALPLNGLGMPGCTLLANLDGVFSLAPNGTFPLALPVNSTLLGLQFFDQAFVFDPTANTFGFVASNGGVGTIGVR